MSVNVFILMISHNLKVTLEPSTYTDEKFELYVKYQADIHNDHRESESGFTSFLVDSPLEVFI